jgi:hypothetical protein
VVVREGPAAAAVLEVAEVQEVREDQVAAEARVAVEARAVVQADASCAIPSPLSYSPRAWADGGQAGGEREDNECKLRGAR